MNPGTDPTLAALRAQVAVVDDEILELVNRRVELVAEIKRHKAENGIAFLDTGQETRLIGRLQQLNPGPLSDQGVERLFRQLLELVKRELDSR
jgi:chorismate mutase/prephenate dehydratase